MEEKVLIIDLDNCLFLDEKTRKGSEEIKDDAWFNVFPEYEIKTLKILLEQIKMEVSGGKGDRKDIVLFLLKKNNLDNSDEEINRRCNLFGKIVKQGILKIGVSKNNIKALELIFKKIPIYANTATPEIQAKEILNDLNLLKFFKGVYGRPKTKLENMRLIIEKERIKPKECLYVDDQESGYLIAREVGCNFMGMHTSKNVKWHININLSFSIIYSLLEIVK